LVTETKQTLSERIVVNPQILVGKPVIRGTRIPVEIVLAHLALDVDRTYAVGTIFLVVAGFSLPQRGRLKPATTGFLSRTA